MTEEKTALQTAVAQYFWGFIRWISMTVHVFAAFGAGYWGLVNAPDLWADLGFDTLSMWLKSSAPLLYFWLGMMWSVCVAFVLFSIVIYPTAMLYGEGHYKT